MWQEVLKTNPEIKKLDFDIAQSQTLIKAARGSYFPEVSLQAGSDVRHRDLGGTKPEWIAGVFMEYPFFEGGLTRAQVAKANSQSLQLLEKKRDRLNGIKVDLTTAWKDQENARQGVATTRQTVATNEEAYASAQALYRHGKAIGLDVLQAQVDLTSSRFNLYQICRGLRDRPGPDQADHRFRPTAIKPARQPRGTKAVKLPGGKKAIGTGIGILIIILLGYRLIWYKPPVPVIAVKQVEIHGKVHGPGTVQSRVPVTVSPKITGILEKLYADQGDRVQKGQLLAELDAIELKARAGRGPGRQEPGPAGSGPGPGRPGQSPGQLRPGPEQLPAGPGGIQARLHLPGVL